MVECTDLGFSLTIHLAFRNKFPPCFFPKSLTTLGRRLIKKNTTAESSNRTVEAKNPARKPGEVGSLSHHLRGFIHSTWLFEISEPSTVGPNRPTNHSTSSGTEDIRTNTLVMHTHRHLAGSAPKSTGNTPFSTAMNAFTLV